MPKLLKYCHVILGDIDTAFFYARKTKSHPIILLLTNSPKWYNELIEYIPNLKVAATTLRYSVNASHQRIGGLLSDGKKIYQAAVREVTPVIHCVWVAEMLLWRLDLWTSTVSKRLSKNDSIRNGSLLLETHHCWRL